MYGRIRENDLNVERPQGITTGQDTTFKHVHEHVRDQVTNKEKRRKRRRKEEERRREKEKEGERR